MGANEKVAATFHPDERPPSGTRAGHEDCWHCDTCGLPICPDCHTDGRACNFTCDLDPRFMGAGTPEQDHTGERGER